MSTTTTYVLWGFHPSYGGPLGIVPIKLSAGTLRQVRSDRARREREGGWSLGIYHSGHAPEGFRTQCREMRGDLTAVETMRFEGYSEPRSIAPHATTRTAVYFGELRDV
jgi:hypothetical protein